ncbi:hypothetical protein LTR36_007809 [Oleoguttula mirabilis]|uniref:Uncharacterized protein n=1 Tax=Oleoguttula mirabilis TaxID=1507867 RepID=A0AAV9JA48_9PEZI|nr:hypothetical protein LTR36_007809 [Oleoguttula mirabilis]
MAQALATLKSLADALGLCKTCTRSLTDDEGEKGVAKEVRAPSSIKYLRSTLTDVAFNDSTHKNVNLVDCEWQDVVFVNCTLVDVTFSKVKLRGVRFYNVDFQHLRFHSLELRDAIWEDVALAQSSISDKSFGLPAMHSMHTLPLLLSDSHSSKATASRLCAESSADAEHILQGPDGSRLRTVIMVDRKPKSLMDLPRPILEMIMVALYHGDGIDVYDCPPVRAAALTSRQTSYRTAACSAQERTTYVAYTSPKIVAGARTRNKASGPLNICTTALRVSKTFFALAVKPIYDRVFYFISGSEAFLAFLHDHRREAYRIPQIVLFYSPKRTTWSPECSPRSWRLLFNVLVHEREDLQSFTLVLGHEFWDVAPWSDGVDAVFRWVWPVRGHIDDDGEDDARPNVLHHVLRLSDVSFRLASLTGQNDGPEHAAFRAALSSRIRAAMRARPRLAKARYGTCKETRLEHCCYYKKH